jgi:hypothetical protein
MLPSIPSFLASLPLSSYISFDPTPDVDACTSNLLISILTQEKMSCFVPHKQFNFPRITSSSFTITSKKLVEADGPLPFFFQHQSFVCPILEQKEHFNPQIFVLCPPPHLAHYGLKLPSLGHAKAHVFFDLQR